MQPNLLGATFAALLIAMPALAETKHAHSHDAEAEQIYKGYFEDSQIADRALSDWEGDWQSVYPLHTSGKLDEQQKKLDAQQRKLDAQQEKLVKAREMRAARARASSH